MIVNELIKFKAYLWHSVDIFLHNVADLRQTISGPSCRVSEADDDLMSVQKMLLEFSLSGRLKVAHIAGERVGESL